MEKKQKVRKRKKRRKKHYLLRLFVILALGACLYFLISSSLFDVQKVTVENNSYFTNEQVIDRAGAKTGANLFFESNTGDMKKALLEEPYIRNAKIQRKLPDTLVIDVEEREEAAAVPYAESYIIIDRDGLVLRKSDVDPKLTMLWGLTIKSMEPGAALEVEENAVLTDTLLMLEAMEDSDMFFKTIDISNVIIKAYIYDNLICKGTPEYILQNLKNGNLEKLLYKLYTEGTERGIINLGDGYCSFDPKME